MTWTRASRWLRISLGRHWFCPACKRHWYVLANAHRHVIARRMPCRNGGAQ